MGAPVRRSALIIGKCLGGATVAGAHGVIVLALAPLVDVPFTVPLVLGVLAVKLLLALSTPAFGVMCAARMTQIQSFMALMQMVILPMFFLAGALFPVAGLPRWLE